MIRICPELTPRYWLRAERGVRRWHSDAVTEEVLRPVPEGLRRFNPPGLVYGVLSVATVIAAESTQRETYVRLVVASVITMVLYWLAHVYADHWGTHLDKPGEWTLGEVMHSAVRESPILVGATVPAVVLVLAWAVGAAMETGVTVVLWVSVIELILLELAAAVHRHDRFRDVAIQTLMGAAMGVAILGLRVVLH
jgi:small neutral amino acid transporter SnatA (MarC family)